jgi:methionyl aminopeptidase
MVSTKTESEINLMSYAGKVAYELLELMAKEIKPGVTTKYLDDLAEKFIRSKECTPACLNYEGYPASICTSINEEVVHGIPSNRTLKNGDIITIDVVVEYKGYMADTARTYSVGIVKKEINDLLKHTEEALYKGLSVIKPGIVLNEVCSSIESVAKKYKYGVIRELTGHGIGTEMHEDPQIPNFRQKRRGMKLQAGMTLAIEPMINMGRPDVAWTDDDWTVVTDDGSLSAHYENTVLVTKAGPEILSLVE